MNLKRRKSAPDYNRYAATTNKRTKSNNLLRLVTPAASKKLQSSNTNLPVSLTAFIGRLSDVEAVCRLIANPGVHLITLYGTAGTGKTRLSLATAEKIQTQFRDGVFFVNLAPISRPELGLEAIAEALGLQDHSQLPLLQKLQDYLQRRELLLILDNFEQIVPLGAAISELLLAVPRLKVLVTSRVVLNLYGENVYTVPTLDLPVISEETSLETFSQNDAVRLFVQRARMVDSNFKLTQANANIIARLCVHLEGLPLAIELAAARSNVFSPQTLLDRLALANNSRFNLLGGGFTNLPLRQQSLADAIEWSYQLLSEPEKQLFRRLGIFAGSCSLAAAAAVMEADLSSTLETTVSLLNKSLIKPAETMPDEELRFTMLETIREYALEKLSETGELEITRTQHSRYFIEMVETGEDSLAGPEQLTWLRRLAADHPNILSTLDYLIETKKSEEAFRLGGSVWVVWWRWGYLNLGRQRLNKILSLGLSNIDSILQAKILDGVAYLAMYQSDYRTAKIYFEQSLKIWREKEVSKYLGRAVSGMAGNQRIIGNYEQALELNYEALDIFRFLGETISEADSLCNIAWQLMERGYYEQVQSMLEASLDMHTKVNYFSGIARAKIYLGDILWRKNEPVQAIQYLEEAIATILQVNHQIRLPSGLSRLGLMYLCQGQLALAEKLLEESVEICEEMHKILDLSYAYSNLGLLRLVQNDLIEAEILFQKGVNLRSEIGQLEGVLWSLEGLAVVALKQAKHDEARQKIEEAQILRKTIVAPILPHTVKFIMPYLASFQNSDREILQTVNGPKVKFQAASEDGPIKTGRATVSVLVDQPPSFELDHVYLSKRESEVLKLVAEGHPNIQIARILVISPGTVNNHLSSIYSKLGVNSRTSAVRYALDHYLL